MGEDIFGIILLLLLFVIPLFLYLRKVVVDSNESKKEEKKAVEVDDDYNSKYELKRKEYIEKARLYLSKGGKDASKSDVYNFNTPEEQFLSAHGLFSEEYLDTILINEDGINFLIKFPDVKELYRDGKDISKIQYEYCFGYDEIKYYKLDGSVHKEQEITGGGGGGSSIKGAVIGGVIAGDVGAIIGSRQKVDEIKTTYKEVDDRVLKITFNNENILELSYIWYEKLLDYIPEKEYDNYIENKKSKGRK